MKDIAKVEQSVQALEVGGPKAPGGSSDLKKIIELSRRLSPEQFKELLRTVPSLNDMLVGTVKSMRDIGCSVEETKRARWEVLRTAAEKGTLTGDQLLEAIRIIATREEKERINWDLILTQVGTALLMAVATAATVAIAGLFSGKGQKA